MIESGSAIAVSHIFSILIDTLLWPWAFSTFDDLIMLIVLRPNL